MDGQVRTDGRAGADRWTGRCGPMDGQGRTDGRERADRWPGKAQARTGGQVRKCSPKGGQIMTVALCRNVRTLEREGCRAPAGWMDGAAGVGRLVWGPRHTGCR
eukprot:354492-Chlamydomonas_euryale.AAC.2